MKDSIIVGFGLAGFAYAMQLKKNGKSFVIVDNAKENASKTAAGIINPTVLKRYTLAWRANAFLEYANTFYTHFEKTFHTNVFESISIRRYFSSIWEQNHWSEASGKKELEPYLQPEVCTTQTAEIKSPYGYGELKNSSRLDIGKTLIAFKKNLDEDSFLASDFDYAALEIEENGVAYKDVKASNVVFCEGFGLSKNLFFSNLPLIGNKGEMLLIKCPQLKGNFIIKAKGVFVVPIHEGTFWVGATFNWTDKTTETTQEGRNWLEEKLEEVITVPYKVVTHTARIRPTVVDRRPLLGQHPLYKPLYVFNGLGTRGVLMAPLLSEWLFNFVTFEESLPKECTIDRFIKNT